MPEPVTRWKAKNGSVHDTFEDAIVCDLASVLGKIGNGDNSMTPAIARKIIEESASISELLRALSMHKLQALEETACKKADEQIAARTSPHPAGRVRWSERPNDGGTLVTA